MLNVEIHRARAHCDDVDENVRDIISAGFHTVHKLQCLLHSEYPGSAYFAEGFRSSGELELLLLVSVCSAEYKLHAAAPYNINIFGDTERLDQKNVNRIL